MKKSVKLIILAAVLIAAIGGLFAAKYFTNGSEAGSEPEADTIIAASVDTTNVKTFEWSCDGETIKITRNGSENWYYSKDKAFPLSRDKINEMLSAASSVAAERSVCESCTDFEQYGLTDCPKISFTLSDGSTKVYLIGSDSLYSESYYFAVEGEKTVYLIGSDLHDKFDRGLYDIIQNEEIPAIENFTEYEAITKTTDIKIVSDGKDGYTVDDGKVKKPADSAKINPISSALYALSFTKCVDYKGNFKKYGLDEPSCTIRVKFNLENGDDEVPVENSFNLVFGSLDEDKNYYVCIEGSNMIYTISSSSVEALLISEASPLCSAGE